MELRSLTQDFHKSVVFPLLLAGTLSVTAPVVQGAVDKPGTLPPATSASITVPLFTQSTATGSVSYLRIINHSTEAGAVSIVAYDDAGSSYGPATLEIDAGEAVHFNAGDLEAGNADKSLGDKDKALGDGIGTGTGAWRLELTSTLDIEVLSYSRTEGGVVSGMQDVVARTGSGYRVWLFNPGSTVGQVSRLRLVNRGAEAVAATIEGVDDAGESGVGAVRLSVPARGSRMVTAAELESGDGEGLSGALGDGSGKWRLLVTADGPIEVMNLLASTVSGEMTNLSSGAVAAEDGDDGATTIHEVGLFPRGVGRESGGCASDREPDAAGGASGHRDDRRHGGGVWAGDAIGECEGRAGADVGGPGGREREQGTLCRHGGGHWRLASAAEHEPGDCGAVVCASSGSSGRTVVGDARLGTARLTGSPSDAVRPRGDAGVEREPASDQSIDDGSGRHDPGCRRHGSDARGRGAADAGGGGRRGR